jgi:hypothetical protein
MTQPGYKTMSHQALATAASLVIDSMTAEVVSAFRIRGIRAIVLKGPSFARWLYPQGGFRPYVDADLLISPSDFEDAQAELRSLGFRYGLESSGPEDGLPEGLGWQRGETEVVDLHQTLRGAESGPSLVWHVLTQITETQRVGGLDVEVLAPEARAMHVALHAADPGPGRDQALEDLSRALDLVSLETWKSAAELAVRLDAIPAFATGLNLLPPGKVLVEHLQLSTSASMRTVLVAQAPARPALSLEELSRTQGLGAKLRFMGRKLFPSKTFMRAMYPLARRGWMGLTVSYCRRIASRVLHLPAAVNALRRARRARS